jgi:hypothetical protein
MRQASFPHEHFEKGPVLELADWADKNTWGSSMFLFPDAGRALYPGMFRAASRRALYVDWMSGSLSTFFESFAEEWRARWQLTMAGKFSPAGLKTMLPLPIDYYVLKRTNKLIRIPAVFANREFVVYDAHDLRKNSSLLDQANGRSRD